MIDIHIHILPDLDDGPAEMEEALDMARQCVSEGIKEIVATPHIASGLYHNNRESISQRLKEFQDQLKLNEIPLKVHLGAEYMLEPNIPQLIKEGKIITIGDFGHYLLIEFPMAEIPFFAEQLFFEINILGITPVLAHPERNNAFLSNPEKLIPFIKRGVLCQGNAGSFLGQYGQRIQHLANYYLKHGCFHFIGSDAHGTLKRKTQLSQLSGLDKVLTQINPKRILDGQAPISLFSGFDVAKNERNTFLNKLLNKFIKKY